jgi:hypothetical protein
MPRIAISGHRGLNARTTDLINQAIREKLSGEPSDVTGLSCLADGADQIFARAVVDLGEKLEVIVPAEKYRAGLPAETHAEYDELLARAVSVHLLPFTESTSESHMAASKLMVDNADKLYAVWDGMPARAYGGTADAVAYARDHSTPIDVIWPIGATRE